MNSSGKKNEIQIDILYSSPGGQGGGEVLVTTSIHSRVEVKRDQLWIGTGWPAQISSEARARPAPKG